MSGDWFLQRTTGDSPRISQKSIILILAQGSAEPRSPPVLASLALTNAVYLYYLCRPTMTANTPPQDLAFDLAEALRHLCDRDEQLKRLIAETAAFQIDVEDAQSPYEVLLESIAYQSISGKAAATIFGRIKALGANGRPPTPEKMVKIPTAKLRKAGLSGAKAAAMKDLAKKALAGIVPTHEEALRLSDEELVETAGIRAWNRRVDRGNVSDFPIGAAGCAAYSRSGREKRMVGGLRKKTYANAKRIVEIWRALAAVSHGRKLVYVACLRKGRLRLHEQNPTP